MTLMGTSTNHRREANSRSLRKVVRSKRWNRATAYIYTNYIITFNSLAVSLFDLLIVDFLTILYEMSWKVTQLQPESRAPSRQQAGPGMKSHQIPRPNLRSYKSAKAEEFTFGLATFWPESQCQNSNLKDLKLMKEFMSPMSPFCLDSASSTPGAGIPATYGGLNRSARQAQRLFRVVKSPDTVTT